MAFTCHNSRLLGPEGWHLSFSCSSPALWLLLAASHAYLAQRAGAFPSPVLPLLCGFYLPPFVPASYSSSALWLVLATIRAYLAHWAGAFASISTSCCVMSHLGQICLVTLSSRPTPLLPLTLLLALLFLTQFLSATSLRSPIPCTIFLLYSLQYLGCNNPLSNPSRRTAIAATTLAEPRRDVGAEECGRLQLGL